MTFQETICRAAEEGAVLLKNEEYTLPFTSRDSIAVFGRCQKDWYRSGTGSGGSVHVSYTTTLIDSLLELSLSDGRMPHIDVMLAKTYSDWIQKNPYDNGGGAWGAEPWCQKEMELSKELLEEAGANNTKAVYVIGRTAGEDKDNAAEAGSWYLSEGEKAALKAICSTFEDVCIVLNVSNIIDLSWIDDDEYKGHIKAVLLAWQGGQEGGRAAARLLCGLADPCGKLSDTIAKSIDDYPSTNAFGKMGDIYYKEDIYVGYRYFSTFAPERILFPFGFGLSYTSFSIEEKKAAFNDEKVTVQVLVTNTGRCSGKEVVQLYLQSPQGKLGKAERVLAAFKKTRELKAEESQLLELSFELSDFASYDDSGAGGNKSAFILEEGLYKLYAGTDSRTAKALDFDGHEGIRFLKTQIVKKVSQALAPTAPFTRLRPGIYDEGSWSRTEENVPLSQIDMAERIKANLPEEIPFTGDRGIRFKDVIENPAKTDAFIAQIEDADLAAMVRGEGMMSQKVTVGIAAAYGGITQSLRNYGIPAAGCSDGPSGIRLDTGKEASLMPIGTLLACTWNPDLIEELYTFEGKELLQYEIDSLLGPGANIHRSPLNGRNFEYYSEDPLLSGIIATSALSGLNKGGSSGTIKHFAANNQESFRRTSNSVVSERALREIYLKPFEIAVKSGQVKSLMTSYNAINGHWSASNYDLVTTILKKEWKYRGLVMTDWWATMNDCIEGGRESIKKTGSMIRSGNDLYMVVDNDGAEKNMYDDDTLTSLEKGSLTRAELHAAAKNILNFILISPVAKKPLRPLKIFKTFKAKIKEKPENASIVKEGENFLPEKTDIFLHAEHNAMYNISGTYSKEGDDLSQSVTNILIDGIPAASLECRSTAGIESTVNAAQVELEEGWYKISLAATKPGITVKKLNISSQVITPVSMGVIPV